MNTNKELRPLLHVLRVDRVRKALGPEMLAQLEAAVRRLSRALRNSPEARKEAMNVLRILNRSVFNQADRG